MKHKKPLKLGRCYACDNRKGKVNYGTEKDALRAVTLLWGADPNADIRDLHAYRCTHSGFWHVGHKSYYEETLKRMSNMSGLDEQNRSVSTGL
jgi:hypothetical protein